MSGILSDFSLLYPNAVTHEKHYSGEDKTNISMLGYFSPFLQCII